MTRRPNTAKHYLPSATETVEELPLSVKVSPENETPSHMVVRPVGDAGIMQFQLCYGNRVVTRWLAPWEGN